MPDLETAAAVGFKPSAAQLGARRARLCRASIRILGLVAVGTIGSALVRTETAPAAAARARAPAAPPARRRLDPEVEAVQGRRLDVEAETTKVYKYANDFCVGKIKGGFRNADKDGNGYICRAAVGKLDCATPEQLGSLRCACDHCFIQCGMRNTPWELCAAPMVESATPSRPTSGGGGGADRRR
jgi:hypothetical protein